MESDLTLIELVEKCTHLYDKSRPDYKDRIKTRNSWLSIAEVLNSTAAECEHRWTQLRERFSRERRSLKTGSPSGSGFSKLQSPSAIYQALQFLESHVRVRRTRTNILKRSLSPSKQSSNNSLKSSLSPTKTYMKWDMLETDSADMIEYLKSLESKTDTTKEIKELNDNIKMEPSEENNMNTLNKQPSSLKFHSNTENVGNNQNKQVKAAVSNEMDTLQRVSEALVSVKGLCESADKSDDIPYNFCSCMYSQLKKMSKKKQKIARTKISAIMLELESDSE